MGRHFAARRTDGNGLLYGSDFQCGLHRLTFFASIFRPIRLQHLQPSTTGLGCKKNGAISMFFEVYNTSTEFTYKTL
jgi:hypothetical protein